MRSGITRRWLRGNLLITVLVVLLAEAMFLYSYTPVSYTHLCWAHPAQAKARRPRSSAQS